MGVVFGRDAILSWFCDLAISGQVALLKDPHSALSPDVARHIADRLGEQVLIQDEPSDGSRRWRLAEPAAQQLSVVRKKLDKWWNSDSLTNIERNHLIEHRADDEPPPHAITVEPVVILAYLEMKARAAPPL
jgi:hypothetical protein